MMFDRRNVDNFEKSLRDGLLLLTMYVAAIWVVDGIAPTREFFVDRGVKYLLLYVVAATVLRHVNAEYADALAWGATIVTTAKFISVLDVPIRDTGR